MAMVAAAAPPRWHLLRASAPAVTLGSLATLPPVVKAIPVPPNVPALAVKSLVPAASSEPPRPPQAMDIAHSDHHGEPQPWVKQVPRREPSRWLALLSATLGQLRSL
jgi:hypothetical protein